MKNDTSAKGVYCAYSKKHALHEYPQYKITICSNCDQTLSLETCKHLSEVRSTLKKSITTRYKSHILHFIKKTLLRLQPRTLSTRYVL